MNPCEICSEPVFDIPNKEGESVKFITTHDDGSVSTGYYWPCVEPPEPKLCYLHAKMDAGLCNPVTVNSSWLEWKIERERPSSSAPRSMHRLEELLRHFRHHGDQAFQADDAGQKFGNQA